MIGAPGKTNETQEDVRRSGRRRFLQRMFLGATALSAAGVAKANQLDHLQVVECAITLAGWPASKHGYTIAQISDLHNDNADAVARTRRAVALAMARNPDVAVVTGDFVTGGFDKYLDAGIAAVRPLTDVRGGAFAILGNHDYYGGRQEEIAARVAAAGLTVLRNRSAPIPGVPSAWFVGLDDVCASRQDQTAALRGVPAGALRILLVHEPDYADLSGPGFALQLSGHSHGGQVRVPGLPPIHEPSLGRRYPEGLQQGPYHPVYTTRGVGVTGIPLRLCCPPEVTLIRLCTPGHV